MSVIVDFLARDKGLGREVDKQAQEAKKLEREYKAGARAAAQLEREAKKAFQEGLSPLQRYNDKVRDLRALLNAGRINQDQFTSATAKAKREMEGFGNATNETFGNKTTAAMTGFLGRMVSITGSFIGIQQAVASIVADMETGRKFSEEGKGGVGLLRQVADSQEEFDRLTGAARNFVTAGAAENIDQAGRIVFTLQSADLLDDVKVFRDLGGRGILPDIETAVKSTKQLVQGFGKDETGGAQEILTKSFIAGGFSSAATAEQILAGAGLAGSSARELGISDEQILAAVAVLSSETGTAETASTAITALLQSVDKAGGFEGQDLQQIVQTLDQRGLGSDELFKLLGRKEAVKAFRGLREHMATYQQAAFEIEAAQGDADVIARRLKLKDTPTDIQRRLDEEQGKTGRFLEGIGAADTLLESVRGRERRTQLVTSGTTMGAILNMFESVGAGTGRIVEGPMSILEDRARTGRLTKGELEEYNDLVQLQKRRMEEERQEAATAVALQRETNELLRNQANTIPPANDETER